MINFFSSDNNINLNEISNDDKKSLISSILIDCAKEDGNISETELKKISEVLLRKFNLNEQEISDLVKQSIDQSNKRVEMYSLVKKIRNDFSHEEIIELFVFMWEIILSDGVIDDFESSLMRKAVGLFHLTDMESAEAKKIAKFNIDN